MRTAHGVSRTQAYVLRVTRARPRWVGSTPVFIPLGSASEPEDASSLPPPKDLCDQIFRAAPTKSVVGCRQQLPFFLSFLSSGGWGKKK